MDADDIKPFFCKTDSRRKRGFRQSSRKGTLETGEEIEGSLPSSKASTSGHRQSKLNAASTQFHGNATRNPGAEHWVSVYPTQDSPRDQRTDCPFRQHSTRRREMAEHLMLEEKWPEASKQQEPEVSSNNARRHCGKTRVAAEPHHVSFAGRSWTLDDDLYGRWPNAIPKSPTRAFGNAVHRIPRW